MLWVLANAVFWGWWLQPGRIGTPWLFALATLALAYDATLLPTIYLLYVGAMRRPRLIQSAPGLRVALVTPCVPKLESFDVIRDQLEALILVGYPHDSWVLDEGNDPAVQALALRLGVRYFSRAGTDRFNQPKPPFKAKTKAGNVNAWLDTHGAEYDYFVQFDIDHRPRPEYLDRVLGYFRDERVAWVQAPSVYGNLKTWVARGAAEQELVLQGPLQCGFFGANEMPFIIGSHCAYRTSAIQQIGGFQPTRAEDHLDTLMLSARGYRGVFVPEIIARGLGPDTFETYLRQQFAWAVSMIQVLSTYTPRLLWRLPCTRALQFLFAQTWYPAWSLSMLVLFTTPVVALSSGQEPAHAPLPEFLLASAPLQLSALVMWHWTRRWHMPPGIGLSWRGMVLHIARWPIVFWALVNCVLQLKHPYMITPKKTTDAAVPSAISRSIAIYVVAAAACIGVVWRALVTDTAQLDGYMLFALLGAAYMLLVVVVNVTADLSRLRGRGTGLARSIWMRATPLVITCSWVATLGLTSALAAPRIVDAIIWIQGPAPACGVLCGFNLPSVA